MAARAVLAPLLFLPLPALLRCRPAIALLTDAACQNAVAAALTPGERRLVEALQTRLELSDADMVKLLIRHQEVLGYSFESNILPTVNALQNSLQVTNAELGKMIASAPSALGLSLEGTLQPRLLALSQTLLLDSTALRALVLKYPGVLLLSVEERLDALRQLLMLRSDELRSLAVRYPQVLSLSAESNIVPTIDALIVLLGGPDDDTDEVAADVRSMVLRLPTLLGLSVASNLQPKVQLLTETLALPPSELRAALLREPAALGASLERSVRPNIELWHDALPEEMALGEVVRTRGLRFLTCNAAKRTRPRLQRAAELGVAPGALLTRMRLTDVAFEDWIRGVAVPAQDEAVSSDGAGEGTGARNTTFV